MTGGTSAASAVALTGTVSGTLSDQHQWFQFGFGGGSQQGVELYFSPVVENQFSTNVVGFTVYNGGCDASGNCNLTQIGTGTIGSLPFGYKYWNTSQAGNYFLEVYNNSGQPTGFGLGLTGSTYPPAAIPISQ